MQSMPRLFKDTSRLSLYPWASTFGVFRRWISKAPLQPLQFQDAKREIIPSSRVVEEEIHDFSTGRYYPIRIGQVIKSKYQVVGKLGYGLGSTVWLAGDLSDSQVVALKVFTNDHQNRAGIGIYKHLESIKSNHFGRRFVRTVIDNFALQGPKGEHQCLVHKPMWETAREFLQRLHNPRLTEEILKGYLTFLLEALDYLHSEAHVIHTDISAHNILLDIKDPSILARFIEAELTNPVPWKQVDGHPVYLSRSFGQPEPLGVPVLCDFGAAVSGDEAHDNDIQPDVYRSPEVCLGMPWSYSVDIWNVGVLVWDLFEGKHLFYGQDPVKNRYLTRAHLAEMIALMGPPPPEFLRRGKRSSEFFTEDGQWRGEIPIPNVPVLEQSEEFLSGANKEAFLKFVRKMLQWQPEHRQTARQLLEDPWLDSAAWK